MRKQTGMCYATVTSFMGSIKPTGILGFVHSTGSLAILYNHRAEDG
jgi:hypothetical protein